MINVSSIAKPSTFVRKMVGIYGQVVKILTLSVKKRFNPDKMYFGLFCPWKGGLYGQASLCPQKDLSAHAPFVKS